MNIKNEFTAFECDRFRTECNFTEQEREVFDLRVDGKERSIENIAQQLNMSTATVNRRIKGIKKKIYKVI